MRCRLPTTTFMKTICRIATFITMTLPLLSANAGISIRTDDAFDVSQGVVVTAGTPTSWGTSLASGIGAVSGPWEPTHILFSDASPGFVQYFEFRLTSVQTIQSITLAINCDDTIDHRGASRFTLWAFNPTSNAFDQKAFEFFPANPYGSTIAPSGAVVESDLSPHLIIAANFTPVTSNRFRAEFVQAGTMGVRVDELDGYTTIHPNSVPEPDSLFLIGGSAAILTWQLRRKGKHTVSNLET